MYATPTNIIPTLLVCFIAWRVVRRVRRNIGRQPVQPKRSAFRIIMFSVVMILYAAISPREMSFMLSLGGGFLAGVTLALVGLRLTNFETTNEGRFYTPNPYIGTALSLLLVGRLVYRMTLLHGAMEQSANQPPALMQSALTLFLFALVAGYYITYFAGILICCRKLNLAKTNA